MRYVKKSFGLVVLTVSLAGCGEQQTASVTPATDPNAEIMRDVIKNMVRPPEAPGALSANSDPSQIFKPPFDFGKENNDSNQSTMPQMPNGELPGQGLPGELPGMPGGMPGGFPGGMPGGFPGNLGGFGPGGPGAGLGTGSIPNPQDMVGGIGPGGNITGFLQGAGETGAATNSLLPNGPGGLGGNLPTPGAIGSSAPGVGAVPGGGQIGGLPNGPGAISGGVPSATTGPSGVGSGVPGGIPGGNPGGGAGGLPGGVAGLGLPSVNGTNLSLPNPGTNDGAGSPSTQGLPTGGSFNPVPGTPASTEKVAEGALSDE